MAEDPQADEEPEAADELRAELDAALRRESELRSSVVEAHRRRLESEDRMAGRLDAALVEAEALRSQLDEHRAQLVAERVRRERLERTAPLRLLKRLARLPALSALRARRARGYQRALARAWGDDG